MNKKTNYRKFLKLAGLFIFFSGAGFNLAKAQNFNPEAGNITRAGVLIDGYDVVSYFIGSPEKGNPEISEKFSGVIFWFANPENRKIFNKNPEKFIPAYGGWCAFAMGDSGEKVKVDPQTFKIIDGKLYLFYNFYFKNTLIEWNEDEANLKKRADANWENYRKH